MRVPAVVVRHHRYCHITKLGFAGQLGFLQIGHADYVHAPAAVEVGFAFGGKLRALHAEVSAAGLADHFRFFAGGDNCFGQLRTDWIGEGHMSNDAVAEKCVYAMTGAVDELIGD